jgi:hypothetical protein
VDAQLKAEKWTIVTLPGNGGDGGNRPVWGGLIGRFVSVCDSSGCHTEYRSACRGQFVC